MILCMNCVFVALPFLILKGRVIMVRTDYVKLTRLEAVAYRQKLKSGGAGIVILKKGYGQPGIATIDKRDSRPIVQANINTKEFPVEAFNEAIELTVGMPYSKRKSIGYPLDSSKEEVIEVVE